jgi:hypothetical protein
MKRSHRFAIYGFPVLFKKHPIIIKRSFIMKITKEIIMENINSEIIGRFIPIQ